MNVKPITVSELNFYIKARFDEDEYLQSVYVKGEISNFKHHYTGHMYFTLKDEKALIKCVMFKSAADRVSFVPKDGMIVRVFGTVNVYERDGVYQIYCKAMEEDGLGDLYKKYEELKKKLEMKGFFANEHKKTIPFMPKTIGVLTSSTGSVICDIINVSTRRNPKVNIKLFSVPVQGVGAAQEIARAISIMNEKKLADVIILARGGGSLEDLWPFNEEIVAEAIYNSDLPVVSAVGHETDFTISDFVADLRAPTPSAAAELVVTNILDVKEKLNKYNYRFEMALNKKIEVMRLKFEKCMNRRAYTSPYQMINNEYIKIDNYIRKMESLIRNKEKVAKIKLSSVIAKVDSLSPLKTLYRGYTLTEKDGKIIKSIKDLSIDDKVNIRFSDGEVKAKIIGGI